MKCSEGRVQQLRPPCNLCPGSEGPDPGLHPLAGDGRPFSTEPSTRASTQEDRTECGTGCATLSGHEQEVAMDVLTHQRELLDAPPAHSPNWLHRHPGILALELGEAALRVRAGNHRPSWPCQGIPRTARHGAQSPRASSRLLSMQLNVTHMCVSCVCRGEGCRGALSCRPPRGSGHAGDPKPSMRAQTKKGSRLWLPSLPLSQCAPPSSGTRRFCDE